MKNNIRDLLPGDWDDVARIYRQGIESNLATFETACPTYLQWDAVHLPFCRHVYVQDGSVLGWVALSPVSGRRAYAGVAELSIYIDECAKGQGVGTKLLNYVIKTSEEQGIWSLLSVIMSDNPVSIALHKKCGFREIGIREKIAQDQFGTWRDTLMMERRSKLQKFGGGHNAVTEHII